MTEDRRIVTETGSKNEFDIMDNPVIPVKREDIDPMNGIHEPKK
jgi:hypothetical protein